MRRDLTSNAMGIDLITFQLEDPFDGQRDLKQGILRAPDPELFIQDPLRFFRVMQFIGRLQMVPDEQLNHICREMDLSEVASERIFQEFEKLFLKSKQPSLGIQWLQDIDRLKEILPQLHDTIGVVQRPDYHPEGDVFEHSKQALDKATELECADEEERLTLIMAALCHDLGKAVATQEVDGVIHAFGHDTMGAPIAAELLEKLTNKTSIKETVPKLVRYHMMPFAFIKSGAKKSAYKRLAKKLAPHTNCAMLAKLSIADKLGRNPEVGKPLVGITHPDIDGFIQIVEQVGVLNEPEPAVLMGADLLDQVKPGPRMGKLLEKAYKIQIEQGVTDKEELKKRIL